MLPNKVIGRPLNLLFPIEYSTTDEAKETIQSYDDVNDRKQGDDQMVIERFSDESWARIKVQLKKKLHFLAGVSRRLRESQIIHNYDLFAFDDYLFLQLISL